jgi:outer membrane protein insertion porin family
VKITGLHKTKSYVVTRVLRQKAGRLYNTAQLAKDYQELRKLDYFESINSKVDVSQPGKVVVTWELKEKRTGQASVGLGYSPRESLVGRVELSESNLFGRGQGIAVAGEIGSQLGGGPSFEISFNEPWLTADRTSLGVSVYDKLVYRFSQSLGQIQGARDQLDRYFERHLGGQVTFGQPFRWPISITLRHDNVDTSNLPTVVDFPRQSGNVSTIAFRSVKNTRDYPQNPTGGRLDSFTSESGYARIQPGGTDNFGNSLYSKLVLDLRRYIALRPHTTKKEPERERESQKIPVLALRLMGGTAVGRLPFFEQFFLGGSESLRGYLEDRFWGQNLFLASAEVRRPFANRFTGVAFVDVGDAWGTLSEFQFTNPTLKTQFKQTSGFNPGAAVGLGLRIATPIGPVRLDYGYGFEGGRLHFSIGHSF